MSMMTLSRKMAMRLVVWLVTGAALAGGTSLLAHASQRTAALSRAFKQEPTVPVLNGVWCADQNKCLAVGYDRQNAPISMTWNGQNWSYVRTPTTGHSLDSLACTSWTHCIAVGYPDVADEWNGASWRVLRIRSPADLRSVACA